MRVSMFFAPGLAVAIALGLATAANAGGPNALADTGANAFAEQAERAERRGLRPAHDGKSGIHRTRSKRYLSAFEKDKSAKPAGPNALERLFGID